MAWQTMTITTGWRCTRTMQRTQPQRDICNQTQPPWNVAESIPPKSRQRSYRDRAHDQEHHPLLNKPPTPQQTFKVWQPQRAARSKRPNTPSDGSKHNGFQTTNQALYITLQPFTFPHLKSLWCFVCPKGNPRPETSTSNIGPALPPV